MIRIPSLIAVLAESSPQLQCLAYRYPPSAPDCPEIALPADLGRLSQLTSLTLDIGCTHITTAEVNAVVETLPLLLTLSLIFQSSEALKDGFPVSIASRCCGLKSLRIVGGMPGNVPSELGLLTALTRLTLNSEMITAIPDSISQLTALQLLKLSICNSLALPEGLSACQFLTRLTICDDVMSPVLAKLHSLRFLSVGSHPQQQYWTQLTALTRLALVVNDDDRSVPTGLSGLSCLRMLKISNAGIDDLPAGPYLQSLESLVLLDCNFERGVPKRLVAASQLRELDLRDAWDCCREVTLADIKVLSSMPALEFLRLDRPVVMNAALWKRRVAQLKGKCATQGRYLQWEG